MKRICCLLITAVSAFLTLSSCLSSEYSYSYVFTSNMEFSESEVTSGHSNLQLLSDMLHEELRAIQDQYQGSWVVQMSGASADETLALAKVAGMNDFEQNIHKPFKNEMERFQKEFEAEKKRLAEELATEVGSVQVTLRLCLYGDESLSKAYGSPLAQTETYTFSCKGGK